MMEEYADIRFLILDIREKFFTLSNIQSLTSNIFLLREKNG